jgi:3-dehydroquinate dehydratase-1
VEARSSLAEGLIRRAAEESIGIILSFHDFRKTPSAEELDRLIEMTADKGDVVVKLATTLQEPGDADVLASLPGQHPGVALCVLGMGEGGEETRVTLPQHGSCLTYGYLDHSNAPGQPSCDELVSALTGRMPAYAADRRARRRV